MASFRKIYSKFRAALQDGWQTGEVASHFGPTASLESMFQYLISLQEAQQILIPPAGDNRINRKGAIEAEKFRNEGNRFYKEKKLDMALLAYNYSILAAPHPPMVNNAFVVKGDEYEVLSLGYANRSALLYETGQYECAITDIERAITFGYPVNRRHRLLERQAKSFLALGRSQEARKSLEEAINLLSSLSLEEKELSAAKESLTKLLDKCESENPQVETTGDYVRLYYTGPAAPPTVSSPQANTTCLSDALKVAYTPARGRHLVAEREIQPGEILIVEDALSAVVKLDATLRSHCSNCLRRTPIPIPCPTCSLVVFCSDKCRSASLSGGHEGECEVLAALVALQLDPAPALAIRVLASSTLPSLRNQLAAIRRSTGSGGGGSKPLLQVVHDYRSLYHLQGHETARSESQLQETAAMAYILTLILLERCTKFLKDTDGNSIMPTEEDITMIGGQLMRLILGIECNVHSTREMVVSGNNKDGTVRKTRGREVGWAVYSALSFTNHSCIPNSLTTSLGSTKFLYSISIIPKGVEITDSYGERYVSHSRAERRKALQEHYFFCCGCAACQSDWPVYQELTEKPHLRCPSCCQMLVGFQCMICKLACTSETALKNGIRLYDAPKTQITMGRKWLEYTKIAEQIHSGKLNAELLAKVLEMLTLLDKYTVHPNRAYISTQETLMTCFDLMGSVVYTDTTSSKT